MISKLDRAINNKTDFFQNRRAPDPLAKQLVESLDSFKQMSHFEEHAFPPNLIYYDEDLNSEQIEEFISRMNFKNLKTYDKYKQKTELRKVHSLHIYIFYF
jgi:hypothetical protein